MDTKILYWYHNKLNNKSTPSFHRHPFYQVEIIIQGCLHIGPRKNIKIFKAPQIVIIPPNIEHTIGKNAGEGEALSFKIKSNKSTELTAAYRQELMFAVMSRILFCMAASPFFRATSTLRML